MIASSRHGGTKYNANFYMMVQNLRMYCEICVIEAGRPQTIASIGIAE